MVANLAFYNQLNIHDLQSLLFTGDVSDLAAVPSDTPLTIDTLRTQVQQTAPHDILRVLAPEMAAVLRRITALSEYVQSLCGYLAANEELEPVHSVLCNLLRTGADFERALSTNPLHLAAGTIKHFCTHPDMCKMLLDPTRRARLHLICFQPARVSACQSISLAPPRS